MKNGCLLIFVQAEQVPEPQDLVDFICKGLTQLNSKSIEKIKLYGQKTGEDNVDWCHEFELAVQAYPATTSKKTSFSHLQTNNKNQQAKTIASVTNNINESKTTSGVLINALNFIQINRYIERALLVAPTFSINSCIWLGLGTLNKKTLRVPQTRDINEEVKTTSEPASPTVAEDTTIVEKPLPILGTTYAQLDFKAKDAEAVFSGTPRPSTPETLAVLTRNLPSGTDVCNLSYSAITMVIYQECIHKGMNYVEVSNIIGWAGKEVLSSGSTVEYIWGDGDEGVMSAVFQDDRLVSKSQVSLK